ARRAPCPAPVLSAPYQHVGDLSHAEHGDGAPPASPATATTSHPSASSSSRVDAAANSADFDAAASTASATAERYPPASRRLIAAAVVPPGELTAARRPAPADGEQGARPVRRAHRQLRRDLPRQALLDGGVDHRLREEEEIGGAGARHRGDGIHLRLGDDDDGADTLHDGDDLLQVL